jgi:predicted nucleotidyltransferase
MELIGYATDFVSFLLQNIKDINSVKSIILFGSVARGEENKDSDVDIFVDVFDEKKVTKEINKIREGFYDSIKFKKYWALLNVKNEINVIVGKIDDWKLKDSMLGSAIILYQGYSSKIGEGKNKAILSWGNVKPDSKRVMINKRLMGYSHYGKKYSGMLEKYSGIKLGANVIIVPIEQLNLFVKTFHEFKIPVKISRILEYDK